MALNIVRELRKKAGIQQKELAISIGVSRPTVSEWESNKKDPSGDRLKKLAEYFGVDELMILGKGVVDLSDENAQDDDPYILRDRLRHDPNYRMLFAAAENAKPEHIRAAAAMLKSLEGENND
jgi:transcriptional regulator with XRE-family HTH domain